MVDISSTFMAGLNVVMNSILTVFNIPLGFVRHFTTDNLQGEFNRRAIESLNVITQLRPVDRELNLANHAALQLQYSALRSTNVREL